MAFSNSYTATIHPGLAAASRGGESLLSSSISSLGAASSPRNGRHHHAGNSMSKIYRQASTLFLTRRLPEALSTILPLITPLHAEDEDTDAADTSSVITITANGTGGANGAVAVVAEPAPLASASRNTRVKVWSLYLTILNAILELEPDEGKDAFGTQEWRAIGTKVRDGDIWEEVVRNGYHGQEGEVDADVVINLATLLLAHAKSQVLNQKRLESYLSYSHMSPGADLSRRLNMSLARRPVSRQRSPGARGTASGTDTPRDLNARVKILELYTLHVLLRNDEWDYSREFITASPILDEERREAFLQALQSLQEDQQQSERLENEEKLRQEEQRQKELQDARRSRAENEERERRRIEEEQARRDGNASEAGSAARFRRHKAPSSAAGSTSTKGGRPKSSRSIRAAPTGQKLTTAASTVSHASASSSRTRSREKANAVVPATSLSARTNVLFQNMWALVEQMSAAFQASPLNMLRMLVFIVALLTMLGKRNLRERVARILGNGWSKIKGTAGMGVKVSYI